MTKYYIVPRKAFIEELEATNPTNAMIEFATKMDMDMNIYFQAVTEEEYHEMRFVEDLEASARMTKGFMKDELLNTFGLGEKDAADVADEAYELYCKGDGRTEYECIEDAYDEFAKANGLF